MQDGVQTRVVMQLKTASSICMHCATLENLETIDFLH